VGGLLALFILVPLVEMALLIRLGEAMGTLPTLALVVVTGSVGATLARRQGLAVMREVQAEAAAGRMPAGPMVDGLLVLVAGVLLLTPGVLTDLVGFALLVPAVRTVAKAAVWRRLEQRIVVQGFGPGTGGPGPFGPGPGGPFGPGGPGGRRPPPGDGPIIDVGDDVDQRNQ
jgi:UPF0716 protein FxsA